MAMGNINGVDNETQMAIDYFIANGWDEKVAVDLVKRFVDEMYNPGEIVCIAALMKLLNSVYIMAAGEGAAAPKLSIASKYPHIKIATTSVSPIYGMFSILTNGKIYVEIRITDGEVNRSIDWIEFPETNEAFQQYQKFINDLITGESEYLLLKTGKKYKLSDINESNYDWYFKNIADVEHVDDNKED